MPRCPPVLCPLSPPAQPASLLPLRLSQPGLCRAAPCGIRALPRRDPSLTSPCWDAATFPAKLCLPWLYYVCVRRSPASRGRQRRRRETGSQSQDKEKAGRQRLARVRLFPTFASDSSSEILSQRQPGPQRCSPRGGDARGQRRVRATRPPGPRLEYLDPTREAGRFGAALLE